MEHKGFTLWMTGLSGSGKSTLAESMQEQLVATGHKVEILDGDIIRTHLSKGLGFSKEDRDTNILRIAFVAHLLSRNGAIVITAAISPYREIRRKAREMIGDFVEVFCDASLEACEGRDVKGLYAKARAGEIKNFTGIDDPYEQPEHPEVITHTGKNTVEQSTCKIIRSLNLLGLIDPGVLKVDCDPMIEAEVQEQMKALSLR